MCSDTDGYDYIVETTICFFTRCETLEEVMAHKTRAEQRARPKGKLVKGPTKERHPIPYRRSEDDIREYIEQLNTDWRGEHEQDTQRD